MNYKLIMLPKPILVDTTVKTIDFTKYQYQRDNNIFLGMDNMKSKGEVYEIIAGIEGLPKLDLSLIAEEIGWVDVEKLAEQQFPNFELILKEDWHSIKNGFVDGFKAAQSLNEKKYSEKDLYGLLKLIGQKGYYVECDGTVYANAFVDVVKEYSESLSKPKEYNVQYIQEGNTIKVTKIL